MNKSSKLPSLPHLLKSKFYKTGQTRGADDDVIFQNRVNRNNTVLIPYRAFENCKTAPNNDGIFDNGFIVLLNPEDFFETLNFIKILKNKGLELGENTLLFYYSRGQWDKYNPEKLNLKPASSRNSPLGGHYVARVPGTTADDEQKIRHGFSDTKMKGAGIRIYEYASSRTIEMTQIQLEFIYWLCKDAKTVSTSYGMTAEDVQIRIAHISKLANGMELADKKALVEARIINQNYHTICPLCLEEISAKGFFSKVEQAEGREVSDLTVTQLNLFHIKELRIGQFNHRPYNLGWGHHHCNMVVKDSGISETLFWMNAVVERNKESGFKFTQTT
jgi:hypothetical protein